MDRRTKIICTLGPACDTKEMIENLFKAGMNVARLNFSHGTHDSHEEVIKRLKEVRMKKSKPLGILLDTKGPELRVGDIENIKVTAGQIVRLVSSNPKKGEVSVNPGLVVDRVEKNIQVLFADGYVRGTVVEKGEGWVDLKIENNGSIESGKGINIPDQQFDLPDMTDQDKKDITFGCEQGVDFIAASFINTAKQLLAIRKFVNQCGGEDIKLIAKIESKFGVENFDEILQIADGIMIARGDLGVEVFVGEVPSIQKRMIRECNHRAKPVIVATQMLESMIQNPRPTRAEASDVANAVFDSVAALMLSGETAIGEYPVESVKMMHEIVLVTENDFDNRAHFQRLSSPEAFDISSALAKAAVNTCFHIGAKAIVVGSNSGHTIQHICRYRPESRIIAVTPNQQTFNQTSMMWGTECFQEEKSDIINNLHEISSYALQKGWVNYGDLLVLTLGKPYGVSFTTNTITVESVGNAIVRGKPMENKDVAPIIASVCFFLTLDDSKCDSFENKIVVVSKLKESSLPKLAHASAIVLQNHSYDVKSEKLLKEFCEKKNVPYICRAIGATSFLKEGDMVRVHPSTGLIFRADSPTEEEMIKKI